MANDDKGKRIVIYAVIIFFVAFCYFNSSWTLSPSQITQSDNVKGRKAPSTRTLPTGTQKAPVDAVKDNSGDTVVAMMPNLGLETMEFSVPDVVLKPAEFQGPAKGDGSLVPEMKSAAELAKSSKALVAVTPSIMSWPISALRTCTRPGSPQLFSKCRPCPSPATPPVTSAPSFFDSFKSSLVTSSSSGVGHVNTSLNCECGSASLPVVGNASGVHFCMTYIARLNDSSVLSLDHRRPCGSTTCPSTAPLLPGTCSFNILSYDLPTHVQSRKDAESGIEAVRTQAALPILCSTHAGLQKRYTELRDQHLSEVFTERDGGTQPRKHGLLLLPGGCFKGAGCKAQQTSKIRLIKGYEACTGFLGQQIQNSTHCIKTQRGGNRETCGVSGGPKRKASFPKLYVKSVAPWNTFQHFMLDKVGFLIAAWHQTHLDQDVHYLVHMDLRDLEIVKFLGIPRSRMVPFHSETLYCAETMLVDTELPGKFGRIPDHKYPRPPELFLNSAQHMQQRAYLEMGWEEAPVRNKIIWLGRGTGRAQAKGTDVYNEVDVLETVRCFTRAYPHLNLQLQVVDAAAYSLPKLAALLAQARVLMGVHGGQMSNIMFAQPDKRTAVIEVTGRQDEFKSYSYGGWAAPLDYIYVPRLCLVPTAARPGSAVVKHAWGKPRRGTTTPDSCARNTYVYASLDDIWNALGYATGQFHSPSCVRPSKKVVEGFQ